MPAAKGKGKFARLLTSRGVIVLEVLLIAFLLVGITKEIVRRVALRREVAVLEKQIAELEAQNRSLGEYVAAINTDSFREREARKRLNLQKPGESVLIVPETTETGETANTTATAVSTISKTSNSHRWWTYFFGSAS